MTSPATGNAAVWRAALVVVLGGAFCAAALAACKDKTNGASPAASASASAAAPASAAASAQSEDRPERGGDEVRPVYPVDQKPPLPLAERYCDVVRELPEKRRQECCPGVAAFSPTGECVRTLSSALRSGAVTIDAAELDTCAQAVTKETAGCDWVTSVGSPTVAACLGIIKGTLKEGAVCRSNLECEEGLRCRGLGATRAGKCGAPLGARRVCNVSTDSLAAFTGQDDFDRHHPECAGYCTRRQCVDATAAGEACTASVQCGPKGVCTAGKCSEGAPPGPGQACTDMCAAGARCSKGKCVAMKGDGESCADDAECRAHCERGDGGKAGQCGRQCPSFPTPKAQPSAKK